MVVFALADCCINISDHKLLGVLFMRRKESRNQVTFQSSSLLITSHDWFVLAIEISSSRNAGRSIICEGDIKTARRAAWTVCTACAPLIERDQKPMGARWKRLRLTYACVHAGVQRGIEMPAGWRKCRWGCNADVPRIWTIFSSCGNACKKI